jgi:hypothetical protein|tara:strand:+ start:2119 stop:2316 length:198 start_codon:yes stop_codon:yes gene_type:complete
MTEIVDFLNNVTTKNFVEAEKQFSELLNDKLTTRLNDQKIEVASKVFNNAPDDVATEVEVADEDI